nr:F-box/kelch-repeat protein At3g23880-like [Ipomoea trifida]
MYMDYKIRMIGQNGVRCGTVNLHLLTRYLYILVLINLDETKLFDIPTVDGGRKRFAGDLAPISVNAAGEENGHGAGDNVGNSAGEPYRSEISGAVSGFAKMLLENLGKKSVGQSQYSSSVIVLLQLCRAKTDNNSDGIDEGAVATRHARRAELAAKFISLLSDCLPAYVAGNNSDIVATDTKSSFSTCEPVAHSARDWCSSRRCKKVVYFDAESDEFKELPTPNFPVKSCAILGLGIIDDDYLCMAREKRKETGEVEVLVMKEYGVKNSWISQFVITDSQFRSGYHRDFTFYSPKYNTQVLIGSCLYGWWGTLVYHFKNKKLEDFLGAEAGHKNHTASICFYVESFASPHEFSWRDDDDQHKNDFVLRFILERFNI